MSKIAELNNLCSRLAHLTDEGEYGAVGKARKKVGEWTRRVEAISITARDGYYAREAKEEDIKVAKAIRDAMTAEYVARGEAERDKALAAIAHEIELIRVQLPGLAAKAAVEAGSLGRAYLAEGGDA